MSVQFDDTADINPKLQCSLCKKWLTVFPIYFNLSTKKFVCGRHEPEDSYLRLSEFESLVQCFKFPCDHEAYGCEELFNIENLRKHKIGCMYRPIICRYCKNWKGNVMQFDQHVNDEHRNAILDSPAIIDLGTFLKLRPRFIKTHFIKVNNSPSSKLFTVQLKFDFSRNILNVCIMYNDREPENALYSYQLEFYSADEKNALVFPQYETQALNNYHNIFLKSGLHKKIDFSFFNSTLQMKPEEMKMKIVILHKENFLERKNSNIDFNNIRINLQCAICLEEMTPPIAMCKTGHSFCSECCSTLDNCPLCKSGFTSTRNYALESIINATGQHHELPPVEL